MTDNELVPVKLQKLQGQSFIVAVIGFIALVLFSSMNPVHFWQSYLTGYLFGWGCTMGCIALLCIIHLAGGRWGYCIRRFLEAGTQTIYIMALLFIPIAIWGMDTLYIDWLDLSNDHHHIVAEKTQYLNREFWHIRSLIIFVTWIATAHCLFSWSRKQDETGDLQYRRKLKFIAGPGLLLFSLTVTVASIDWVMSIEPTWFSSIFGVMFMIGQGLTIWALSILVVTYLARFQPMKEALNLKSQHNLGNLMFAFVILWAYIELSQFIIIWSANLPEEIPWYMNRSDGGFRYMSIFLVMFQFAIPFLLLLSRQTKRVTKFLRLIAFGIIAMRIVDLNWIIAPSIHQPITNPGRVAGPAIGCMDVIAPLAFGALFLALTLRNYRKAPILPTKDPVFSEGFDYKEVSTNV